MSDNRRDWHQIGCAILLLAMFGLGIARHGFEETDIWIIGVVCVCAFFALRRILGRRGQAYALWISHEGLLLERPNTNAVVIPWSRIREAKYSRLFGECRVLDPQGTKILSLPADRVGGRSIARRCARDVNCKRDTYARPVHTR
jgi:hypothetical protein